MGTSVGALVGAIYAFNRSETYGDLPMRESQIRAAQVVAELCLASNFAKFRDIS